MQLVESTDNHLFKIAVKYFYREEYDKSNFILKKYLTINRFDWRGWYYRGLSAKELELFALAAFCFTKTSNCNPKFSYAWYNKAQCLEKCKEYASAEFCYNMSHKLNPLHIPTLSRKAELYLKCGSVNNANHVVNSIKSILASIERTNYLII